MSWLIRSIETFEPNFGTRFSTYATLWIEQFVRRAIITKAFLVAIPVYLFELQGKWKRTERMMTQDGQVPSRNAIAQALFLTRKHLRCLYAARIAMRLRTASGNGGAVVLSKLAVSSDERDWSGSTEQEEMHEAIGKALRSLPPRNAQIIRLRFGMGDAEAPLTLEEVGARFHITRERVRQIEEAGLEKLRKILAGYGPNGT